MVALVSKQVTAYNAVNNSTVSRTSASKYGEFIESSWGGEGALSSTTGRPWTPGVGSRGHSGRLPIRRESRTGKEAPGSRWELSCRSRIFIPREQEENLTSVDILQARRCFRFVIFINVHRVHNNPVN